MVELKRIERLIEKGRLVIGGGGGGVGVVEEGGGVRGVGGVMDKEGCSGVLGDKVEGEEVMILRGVE